MSRPAFRPALAAGRLPAVLALVLVASLVLVVVPPPRPAGAAPSDIPQETSVTNGRVKTMIRVGGRLYLAGYFTQVGPNTGHGVAVDATTGLRNPAFPKVDGVVYAAVPDGAGGWYVGGAFNSVGDVYRKNAAQITASGAVTDWNPRVDGAVYSLAYDAVLGEIFLGGDFTGVGAVARTRLAAVATGAGDLITGWAPAAGGAVRALALRGTDVLAGGDFTVIGGASRSRLAALDSATGAPTAWNPGAGGTVRTLAVAPGGTTVYAGGDFTVIGGASRSRLAALDTATSAPTAWNPGAGGTVRTLAVAPGGTTVYAGGDFTAAGGLPRAALAAVDAATGAVTAWNPGLAACTRGTPEEVACTAGAHSLSVSADGATVAAGGLFTVAGGAARNNLASFAADTGAPTGWDPSPNATVRALAGSGSQVLVGGELTSVNAPTRNRIAALDATTGALDTGFRADANDYVQALALSPDGTRLFLGGDFSKVNGKARTNLAAVDPATGALDTLWNPGAKGGPVLAMSVSGGRLYLGGKFATVAGVGVPRLASVDPVSGAVAAAWRPAPDSGVAALTPSPDGTLLYAGGDFGVIGGRTQRFLAAVRTDTGTVSAWAPTLYYAILTQVVSPDGSRLYVGGAGYNTFGNRASALNTAVNGRPLWETRGDGNVQGLGLSPASDILYIGGHFATQNGVARQHMAAVRTADGVLTPFAPNVNGALGVWSLAMDAGNLSIGGDFTLVAGRMQQGFARFPGVGPTVAVTSGAADGTTSSSAGPAPYGGTASAIASIVVRVEASLDGAPFAGVACSGCGTANATWTYPVPAPLTEGRHTFDFRAVDRDTVPSATTRRAYTVDLTPPALTVTGGPADASLGNDSTPTYSGSATDAGGVAVVEASVDSGPFAAAGVTCTGCLTGSATWTWTPSPALADGPHTVAFRAVDGAGITSPASDRSLLVDTQLPTFLTLTAPGGSLQATFSEPLSCATVAKPDFSATVNGAARTIKTVVCTGVADDTVTLTLATPAVQAGDTVAITLKAPVTDPAGNPAPRPVTRSI
jgi:Big-like domain-containing protein/beta-propeller uncharacterized protein DUF5122